MEKKFRYFLAIPLSNLEQNHIGYYLKKARKILNLKQCRIAEKTMHHDSTISDLERYGANPNFYTIQNYVKALGAEFYAFIPVNDLSVEGELSKSDFRLVRIASDELMKIMESA